MSEIKNKSEIFEALKAIAKNNLLTINELKEILERAIFTSFHKKFDPDAELELVIDETSEQFELINNSKVVVSDEEFVPENRPFEIPLSEAKKIDASVELYDQVAEVVDFASYSKAIAGSIRAMLTQSVKERRKEAVWEKHQSLKGEMIDVTVSSITPTGVVFTLADGTTAYMPTKLINTKITLNIGQRTKVYVEDVLKESKDSQIIVSNGSKVLVKRTLEAEVPEIAQGLVEIVSISRIPGERSKVVVKSSNENIDAVGAVIGAEGSRINAIVEKLDGEKLDVIAYSDEVSKYIANAFAPARIIAVIDKKYEDGPLAGEIIPGHRIVIAPDKHQTLAIGKSGSNARLVVELVNSRIDVLSYSAAKEKGLEFEWNGNISPEEVAKLDQGEKLKTSRGSFVPRPRGERPSMGLSNSIASNSFDADIASFNVEIEDEVATQQKGFEIDDTMFTEEQLMAMQADFELDDDIEAATAPESLNEQFEEDEE